MDPRGIKTLAKRLLPGWQKFNLFFKPHTSFRNLERLGWLNAEKKIRLENPKSVAAVRMSRNWRHIPKRIIVAEIIPEGINDKWFIGAICKDIDKILPVKTHPLNYITAKGEKTKTLAIKKFVREVLAIFETDQLADKGFELTAEAEEIYGLTQIAFRLARKDSGEILRTCILDGITGCMIVDNARPTRIYRDPQELREAMLKGIYRVCL